MITTCPSPELEVIVDLTIAKEVKMADQKKSSKGDGAEKTLIRDISFCGVPENGSNASMVDVKDGKIIRIRPMHYDWKYDPQKDMNPWMIEARGKTFEPSMKTLIPPYSIAYKKRVYSPARIRYPMMRVDFDPNGERNPQNRGTSKYKRISWDQALDFIANEMNRIKEKYGPTALLYESDQHGENKVVQACHGAGRKLLRLWGGFTQQNRQPDSWEGWWWGSKHFWGCEPVGQGMQSNLLYDISKNTELLIFWGCDQETTPWGWQGQLPSRLSYWWTEIGIKQIYVCPDLNYAAAVHADRWIPVLPNTDAALYLAITHHWFKKGTYDKEYLATHAVGVEKYEAYVMGEEDGVPKTPKWAEPITGLPAGVIKALAEEWASKRTTLVIGNGGPGIRGPYATEPARLQCICLAMQGLGKPSGDYLTSRTSMLSLRLCVYPTCARPTPAATRAIPIIPLLSPRLTYPRLFSKVSATGGAANPRQPTVKTSLCTINTRRIAVPRFTWSGPIPHPGLPAGTRVTITFGLCAIPISSSCSHSTRGWRTTVCWLILSCR
jgi:anaerobic selenocysteine-containing dehydrogenase